MVEIRNRWDDRLVGRAHYKGGQWMGAHAAARMAADIAPDGDEAHLIDVLGHHSYFVALPVTRTQEGWLDDAGGQTMEAIDIPAYQEAMSALLSEIGHLNQTAIVRVMTVLANLKDDLTRTIIDMNLTQGDGGTFQAFHMTALSAAVDGVVARFAQQYQLQQLRGLSQASRAAQSLVPAALGHAGVHVVIPAMSMEQIEVAVLHSARLVRYVTGDIRRRIDNVILQAILAKRTMYDLTRELSVVADLPTRKGPGFAKNPMVQAQTILRTEMGRIFALSQRAQFLELAKRFPGMKKKWVHSGSLNPRYAHKHILNQTVIPVLDNFDVNGHPAFGPHDPMLPASETVNCGCALVTILPGQDDMAFDTRAKRKEVRAQIVSDWRAKYGITD